MKYIKDKTMTIKEKRKLLAELVELYVKLGYDITDIVGYPLNRFDWEQIPKTIKKLNDEYEK